MSHLTQINSYWRCSSSQFLGWYWGNKAKHTKIHMLSTGWKICVCVSVLQNENGLSYQLACIPGKRQLSSYRF